MKEKVKRRQEEEESEIDMISNLEFPNFDDDEEKEEEKFVREMRDFQREMKEKKEEWRQKMEGMEREKIQWKWGIHGGTYEGEVKNNRPHGVGRWTRDDGEVTVEGEWKDGKQNGKVVYNGDGGRDEYEAKDGELNGKYIIYWNDGRRW